MRQRRVAPPPPKAVVITGGVEAPINHTTAGRVGELLTAADLLARGWRVYFPLIPNAGCDLVIIDGAGTHVERIEVRCAKRNAQGALVWNKRDLSYSDRRAIVVTGEPVKYDPAFEGDEWQPRRRKPFKNTKR